MSEGPPPGYVATVWRMARALKSAANRGRKPKFQLPHADIMFVAPLDQIVEQVCANKDARQLVRVMLHVSGGEATCTMLQAALDAAGIVYETKNLAELGFGETTEYQS